MLSERGKDGKRNYDARDYRERKKKILDSRQKNTNYFVGLERSTICSFKNEMRQMTKMTCDLDRAVHSVEGKGRSKWLHQVRRYCQSVTEFYTKKEENGMEKKGKMTISLSFF